MKLGKLIDIAVKFLTTVGELVALFPGNPKKKEERRKRRKDRKSNPK